MIYLISLLAMKKFFLIIIPSFLLALVLFLSIQFINNMRTVKGALQVTSSPTSKVYLDNKYLGQTPLCKCDAGDMIKTGEYTIRLVPLDSSLQEFQQKITISESVLTVVDRKFAKDSLSEGYVISLMPLSDKKKISLSVVSFPEGADLLLDNNAIGTTPMRYDNATESDHELKVRKNGYKEKTIRIRTPAGYKLIVNVYLSTDITPPSPVPSQISAPSDTQATADILNTPTGFLRVRDSASTAGNEIARVNPGEKYPLIDEQQDWSEIKLNDGRLGWVSSQYVQKK